MVMMIDKAERDRLESDDREKVQRFTHECMQMVGRDMTPARAALLLTLLGEVSLASYAHGMSKGAWIALRGGDDDGETVAAVRPCIADGCILSADAGDVYCEHHAEVRE